MALSDTAISLAVKAVLSYAGDLASARSELAKTWSVSLANGTGALQADKIYSDHNQLAASATLDVDLAGSLTDILGQALTFVKVKAILLAAASGNTNDVVLGAAATNTFTGPFGGATHTVRARPGGFIGLVCSDATGWAVTAGTGDLLRVANSGAGTTVDYDLVIIGTSA